MLLRGVVFRDSASQPCGASEKQVEEVCLSNHHSSLAQITEMVHPYINMLRLVVENCISRQVNTCPVILVHNSWLSWFDPKFIEESSHVTDITSSAGGGIELCLR